MNHFVLLTLLVALAPTGLAQDDSRFGKGDHCLYFGRGGNVVVENPAQPAPEAALTVECWFRSSARLRKPVQLVACWSGRSKDEDPGSFYLGLPNNNRIGLGLRSAAGKEALCVGSGTWLDGLWHHAAGTWDGTTMVVYLDGEELARKDLKEFGPLQQTARPLVLGPWNAEKARKPVIFDGYLGGVLLRAEALTREEILNDLEFGLEDEGGGLLASYPLLERYPEEFASDESRKRKHGQLSPELARVGWVRARSWWDRSEEGPGLDFHGYDLRDVLGRDGRRILVSHGDEKRVGVLWQDNRSGQISVTWIDPELRTHVSHPLQGSADSVLAAGASDEDGNLYYLLIQKAPNERSADFEVAATLYKAGPDGGALLHRALDVSKSGLNIYAFSSSVLRAGNLRYSKGVLGLILPRTMHRSADGLRHQGAIAVTYAAKDLAQLRHMGQTSGHSMANYMTVSESGTFLALDLGDNYPRGVHLHEIMKSQRSSRLVFTFKTAHSTTPRNGAPVYPEISNDGKTFYKCSNDNGVYTELGGIIEGKKGYTIVFATDQSPEGLVLDNSRAFRGCPDARNLALVHVVHNFQGAPGGSEVSDALMVGLPRNPKVETGGYYDFGGRWKKQRVVGVTWLTQYESGEGAHAPQLLPQENGEILVLWEKSGPDPSLRAMVIDPAGEVITPEFALPFSLHLNRQDRVLRMQGRTYLLAGDRPGGGMRLYFLVDED